MTLECDLIRLRVVASLCVIQGVVTSQCVRLRVVTSLCVILGVVTSQCVRLRVVASLCVRLRVVTSQCVRLEVVARVLDWGCNLSLWSTGGQTSHTYEEQIASLAF